MIAPSAITPMNQKLAKPMVQMKKKLNQFKLGNDTLSQINGGSESCGCSCWGPSSTSSNFRANSLGGWWSIKGKIKQIIVYV